MIGLGGALFYFLGWIVCITHGGTVNPETFGGAPQRGHAFGLLHHHGQGHAKLVELADNDWSSDKVIVAKHTTLKRPIKHIKATVLTFIIYGLFIRLLSTEHRGQWTPSFIIALLCYLVEAATCSTRRYLSNMYTPAQVKQHLQRLREAPPNVVWFAECYHYQSPPPMNKGRNPSNSRTKVVTSRDSQSLLFQRCVVLCYCGQIILILC